MTSENYRQLLNTELDSLEMTKEDFDNTLMHFAMLYHKEQLALSGVGSSALYNDEPLVLNMCLSYRHDFPLLNKEEQNKIIFECKEWLRAYENNK